MSSFSIEEFLGDGALKGLIPKFVEEGWDDVPTIKMMELEDMDRMELTQQQKDALEIRSYLHSRCLMEYADTMESSRKPLAELLTLSTSALSLDFGMKKAHIARFTDKTMSCTVTMPSSYVLHTRQRRMSSDSKNDIGYEPRMDLSSKESSKYEGSRRQSIDDPKLKEGYVFKGIVVAEPAEPRLCGCIQPPPIADDVAPYSAIENISVQKLTPEYKLGMKYSMIKQSPKMKASKLWHEQPVILFCVRRPGCIMCRAQAHQLYLRKPVFDALGFQLIAVLHEQIEREVQDFWPRYWGGVIVLDRSMGFFKALGGGNLLKDDFMTGFLFNPRARANYSRAKATGMARSFKGQGETKGGLFVIGREKRGIAYQFIERNFGDWAPVVEVIEVCTQLQNESSSKDGSLKEVR